MKRVGEDHSIRGYGREGRAVVIGCAYRVIECVGVYVEKVECVITSVNLMMCSSNFIWLLNVFEARREGKHHYETVKPANYHTVYGFYFTS